MVSNDVIDRANKVFQFGFSGPLLDFMRKQPIYPPSGAVRPGHVMKAPRGKNDGAPRTGFAQFGKQKLDNVVDRIAFIKFMADPSHTAHEGALSFDIKYGDELKTAASRTDYIPIWWLPWNGMGAIVKLKIEDANTTSFPLGIAGAAALPNPKFFFTAAVNGCSVIIRGDHRGPSCYHGGIDGTTVKDAMGEDNFDALGGNVEDVWRNLIEGVYYRKSGNTNVYSPKPLSDHQGGQLKQNKGTWAEVNKNDYISEKDPSGGYVTVKGQLPGQRAKTTMLGKQFQEWAQNQNRQTLTEMEVAPWGCIFGVRSNAGTWEMYLQRNATVTYRRLRKKHSIGKLRWGDLQAFGPQQRVYITMALQQFFPDKEAVHYRDFRNIQLI